MSTDCNRRAFLKLAGVTAGITLLKPTSLMPALRGGWGYVRETVYYDAKEECEIVTYQVGTKKSTYHVTCRKGSCNEDMDKIRAPALHAITRHLKNKKVRFRDLVPMPRISGVQNTMLNFKYWR